jgi:hypothetical protein
MGGNVVNWNPLRSLPDRGGWTWECLLELSEDPSTTKVEVLAAAETSSWKPVEKGRRAPGATEMSRRIMKRRGASPGLVTASEIVVLRLARNDL